MNAAELLARARAAGLFIELDAAGELWVEADRAPPPGLLEELRRHRAAIAAELRAEREFEAAAERRRAREAALIRDGDLALLEAERRALATLGRADRALATVELDPELRAEGVLAPADPVEPLLEALKLGALDRARELFETAGIDARGLDLFVASCVASSDPARARRELAHALAGEPSAFDRPERTCAPTGPARRHRMPASPWSRP